MNNVNILLPSDEGYAGPRKREEILDAIQQLDTIRAEIGDEMFSKFANNAHLYRAITQGIEIIRENRPVVGNNILTLVPHKRSMRARKDCFMVSDRRRILKDEPVRDRLEQFKNSRLVSLRHAIKGHIGSSHYDKEEYRFEDAMPPRFRADRKKRRWTQNRFEVSYDVVVGKDWIKSGAKELASIFEHKFFPITCEPVVNHGEARAYKVHRAVYKSLKGEHCEVKEDVGYAAYILRPGDTKGNLTGWSDTLEGALKAIEKQRAKEARDRLLKI